MLTSSNNWIPFQGGNIMGHKMLSLKLLKDVRGLE